MIVFCNECGTKVEGKFCPNCGKVVNEMNVDNVEVEKENSENSNKERYEFSAQKIASRSIKKYITLIEIEGENVEVTNNFYKNKSSIYSKFKKEDVLQAKKGLTTITNGLDLFRYGLAVAFCFIPAPPILWGIAMAAFTYYSTLIKTVKINLKNGTMVKVYYKNKEDIEMLKKIFGVEIN
jgi:hypothetical protein